MSTIYRVIEKGCFMINKLPGGGVKGNIFDLLPKEEDKIRLPGFMKRGLIINELELEGFKYHRIRSLKEHTVEKRAVLFLPGGGGMARAIRLHYDTVKRIAIATGAEVIMAHYPLAPKYNVRFALDWLEKLYSLMLEEYAPENITFIGDSAGANLILSITNRVAIRPGRLIVISPACGLENGKNRDIRKKMEPKDPLFTVATNDTIAENWCRNVPLDSPDISPEYISYDGFPPVMLFYGSHELFYPHVRNMIRIMEKDGVRLCAEEQPMCHDWALCSFLPEGRMAIKKMSRVIIDNHFSV